MKILNKITLLSLMLLMTLTLSACKLGYSEDEVTLENINEANSNLLEKYKSVEYIYDYDNSDEISFIYVDKDKCINLYSYYDDGKEINGSSILSKDIQGYIEDDKFYPVLDLNLEENMNPVEFDMANITINEVEKIKTGFMVYGTKELNDADKDFLEMYYGLDKTKINTIEYTYELNKKLVSRFEKAEVFDEQGNSIIMLYELTTNFNIKPFETYDILVERYKKLMSEPEENLRTATVHFNGETYTLKGEKGELLTIYLPEDTAAYEDEEHTIIFSNDDYYSDIEMFVAYNEEK